MDNNFNVRQTRTVGDALSDTFTYIRVYYKNLAKMIAVYVLAPLMVGSIILSSSMGELMAGLQDQPDPNLFGSGLEFFAGFFFLMIAYILLMGVVYQHLYYAGKGKVPDSIHKFSNGMFSKLLRLIPVILIVTAMAFIFLTAMVFFIIEISGFLFLLFIPAAVYLMIKVALFPIAFFVEDTGGFNSLSRSWELTDGYFWQTLGVYLLITIVFGILSQLLSTPLFVVMAIAGAGLGAENELMNVLITATYAMSFVFQVLFFAAQSIALGLHYFNLEERKEGHTLSEQVAGLEGETA